MSKKTITIGIFIYILTGFLNLTFAQTSNTDYTKAGVSDQIKQFLCAPSDPNPASTNLTGNQIEYSGANNTASGDLYNCINRLYRFAIVVAAVVGVFFIVIAGYLYMSAGGNQEGVDKAKSILETTITSLVILFAGYILLKAINPDLVLFKSIQPPSVVLDPAQTPGGGGGSGGGNTNPINTSVCKVNQGGCNISQLSQCGAWDANTASSICYIESGHGNPAAKSGSDVCKDGTSFSIGLFQINIIAHGGGSYMPAACKRGIIQTFGSGAQGQCLQRNGNGVCVKYDCQVVDVASYNACVEALIQPSVNIGVACSLYQRSNGWSPWAYTNNLCRK